MARSQYLPLPQNEQPQQSPLPKNTETPKATWVQANHSVVPLYENQREINGSHINNGEIIFPQESDSPHKPKLDTELLQNKNYSAKKVRSTQ